MLKLGLVPLPPVPDWIAELAGDRPTPELTPVSATPASSQRVDQWAAAALLREANAVREAPEGTRNATLNTAAFNLGTIVGGGALEAGAVRQALLQAALQAGLGEHEATKTIDSGLRAGMSKNTRSAPVRDQLGSNGSNGHAPAPTAQVSGSYEPEGPNAPDVKPLAEGSKNTPDVQPMPRIEIINTTRIFAPLPPQRWAVPGLQIGPGRPTLIAGYGSSAKSISTQAVAVALTAGTPIFEHFQCSPMTVLHIDFEQGETDSRLRYQRLARGMGIDPSALAQRLNLAAMPSLRLYATDKDAEDQFRRVMDGVDLVIIDSFRASSPAIDENDSRAREIIDMWTRLSLSTGAAILLIHHSNKPTGDRDRDVRAAVRGSSGIFDACGAVFLFDRKPGKPATRVRMIKSPTSACGGAVEPFDLLVEDVPSVSSAAAGVRVVWREASSEAADIAEAVRAYEDDAARLLHVITDTPGQQQWVVRNAARMKKQRALEVLRALEAEGRISVITGPKGAKAYWPAGGEP